MDKGLVVQFVVIGAVALLAILAVRSKSFVANRRARKNLGGALFVMSSFFGGSQYDPNAEPELDKSGQLKDDEKLENLSSPSTIDEH